MQQTNPFSKRSDLYAHARPQYPEILYEWMASECFAKEAVWDCATGNGQAAVGLSKHFENVYASDSSEAQIANSIQLPNIIYSVRSAEASNFGNDIFDLVCVAQALHWFDFHRFWQEVSRVARPGALFCAWGYSWLSSTPTVDETLILPLRKELEPFWATNNRLLWEGYKSEDIAFPYPRINTPSFEILTMWTLDQLIEYLQTWSAYKRSRKAGSSVKKIDRIFANVKKDVESDELLPIKIPLKVVAGHVKQIAGS